MTPARATAAVRKALRLAAGRRALESARAHYAPGELTVLALRRDRTSNVNARVVAQMGK